MTKELNPVIVSLTEDAKCAWQNVHILERARQAQDKVIAQLRFEVEQATGDRDQKDKEIAALIKQERIDMLRVSAAMCRQNHGTASLTAQQLDSMADEIEKDQTVPPEVLVISKKHVERVAVLEAKNAILVQFIKENSIHTATSASCPTCRFLASLERNDAQAPDLSAQG